MVTELDLFIQMVHAFGIPPQLTLKAIYGPSGSEGQVPAPGWRDEDGEDVHRRSLLLGSAFAAAAVVAPELFGRADSEGARRLGAADVASMQQMALQFRSMDRRLGGGRVRPLVTEYLTTTVHGLLRNGCVDGRTRNSLLVAAADLTRLAGWMAFDAGDGGADRYFTQAVSLSELASDKAFGADVLVTIGNQLVHLGSSQRAKGVAGAYGAETVELATAGLSATRRCGTPTAIAILHVLSAHGHALVGDESGTAQSLLAAERALDQADPADEPAWIHGFDRAQLASDAMRCYRDLGRPHKALAFFEDASAAPDGQTRSRCLTELTLASVRTQEGEAEEACRIGRKALALAGDVRSIRIRDNIRSLLTDPERFSGSREVHEFRAWAGKALTQML